MKQKCEAHKDREKERQKEANIVFQRNMQFNLRLQLEELNTTRLRYPIK